MLATFSDQQGGRPGKLSSFFCVCVIFRYLGRHGPLLARIRLHSGKFEHPFKKFLGCIFEVSGHDLGPMWLVNLLCF